MKISILVGSLSKNSMNRKLGQYLIERFGKSHDINILDIDLPLFDYELEDNFPKSVVDVKDEIKNSDGIIIITPEYNHSIPAALKNIIDWSSRGDLVLAGKPNMIMGATMGGFGTVRAQSHLKEILECEQVKTLILPNHEVLVSNIHEKIDSDGKLADKSTMDRLDSSFESFISWIDKSKCILG